MPCVDCRTLRLVAVGLSDELRHQFNRWGFNLPPIYLRLVAPMADPKALALLPLQVGVHALQVGVRGAAAAYIHGHLQL